jgi:hypothetical protein
VRLVNKARGSHVGIVWGVCACSARAEHCATAHVARQMAPDVDQVVFATHTLGHELSTQTGKTHKRLQ